MIYEFIDEADGRRVEVSYPMGQAPSIGEVIERDGRRLRRVASTNQAVQDHTIDGFASHQHPRWMKGWHKFDREGRPVFNSMADVRECCARSEGTVHWDR